MLGLVLVVVFFLRVGRVFFFAAAARPGRVFFAFDLPGDFFERPDRDLRGFTVALRKRFAHRFRERLDEPPSGRSVYGIVYAFVPRFR